MRLRDGRLAEGRSGSATLMAEVTGSVANHRQGPAGVSASALECCMARRLHLQVSLLWLITRPQRVSWVAMIPTGVAASAGTVSTSVPPADATLEALQNTPGRWQAQTCRRPSAQRLGSAAWAWAAHGTGVRSTTVTRLSCRTICRETSPP
jgi:hypothetical protein